MEDLPTLHLTSPPSSLSDSLLAPRVSTPPVPRPRKTSSSSCSSPLALTSTPKTPSTNPRHPPPAPSTRHLPPTPHTTTTNGYDRLHNRGCRGQHGMQRAPSLDSATPLSPITQPRGNASDSESEGESSPSWHRRSTPRLGCSSQPHPRHHRKPQSSYSLPCTPRVNGGSHHHPLHHHHHHHHNGSITNPHTTLPSLQTPQDPFSPTSSQYVTCPTGVSHLESSVFNTGECQVGGGIDYSSLPLPADTSESSVHLSHISRHLSEPCIPQARHRSPVCATRLRGGRAVGRRASRENVAMDNIRESGQSEGEGEVEEAYGPGPGAGATLEVQWRFIQTLVAELNTTKASHRRLMAELHQAKMEVQVLRATLDAYTDVGLHPGSISEMVGQIHAAQKVRDEAMMARIKLANEERDAALTHSRAMIERLSLSPRSSEPQHLATPPGGTLEVTTAAELEQQQLQQHSGGNSSSNSPYRLHHHRNHHHNHYSTNTNEPTIPTTTTPTPTTSTPQGRAEAATLAQLAVLEEEVRSLRHATGAATINTTTATNTTASSHHSHHDGGGDVRATSGHGASGGCRDCAECGLSGKSGGEEAARGQLEEQCARLECLAAALRHKITGLGLAQPSTKVTLVDLALHPQATLPAESNQSHQHHSHNHRGASTSSEGDPRDSLSSLESVETASASSWKRGDVPGVINDKSQTSTVHSSYLFVHHGSGHTQENSAPPPPTTPPRHNCHNKTGERDPRNIPGVTIVGPITEL